MRAMGSVEPPGGYGTTNFTGLAGQDCANAACGPAAQSASATSAAIRKTTAFMIPPLPGTRQVTIRPMKIAMMGSGGVGGFFGGRLAHRGYDLGFIPRGAHLPPKPERRPPHEQEPPRENPPPQVRDTHRASQPVPV